MYREQESVFYYLTVMNEQYEMPPMPDGARDGHPQGHVPAAARPRIRRRSCSAQLFGSGAILNEVLAAQKLLEKYNVAADVWSVTQLQGAVSRRPRVRSLEHAAPGRNAEACRTSTQCSKDAPGVIVAASDYLKVLPDSIDQWMPRRMRSLGTDGFGRSEDRERLRDFFEVDARFVTLATLAELAARRCSSIERSSPQAIKDLDINPEKLNPAKS